MMKAVKNRETIARCVLAFGVSRNYNRDDRRDYREASKDEIKINKNDTEEPSLARER